MGRKIKTCILGNSSVGKTTLILRIVEGVFKENIPVTTSLDYKSQKKIINNENVLVELWDTTGQEKYRSVVSNFFKGSDGIFLVFDITNEKSLNDLDFWLGQLAQHLDPEVPKVLLANKSDLQTNLPASSEQKIKRICEQNHLMFYKVSAKSGLNLQPAFNSLVDEAYKYICKKGDNQSSISVIQPQEKKKKGCC